MPDARGPFRSDLAAVAVRRSVLRHFARLERRDERHLRRLERSIQAAQRWADSLRSAAEKAEAQRRRLRRSALKAMALGGGLLAALWLLAPALGKGLVFLVIVVLAGLLGGLVGAAVAACVILGLLAVIILVLRGPRAAGAFLRELPGILRSVRTPGPWQVAALRRAEQELSGLHGRAAALREEMQARRARLQALLGRST